MKTLALILALLFAAPALADCNCGCQKADCNCQAQQGVGHMTPSVRGMTIEFHLTQHHGVDIRGMSVAQMEAAHQAAHRGVAHTVTRSYRPSRTIRRWR